MTTTAIDTTAATWAPRLLSIFRIVLALLFISHGLVKLFGFPAGAQPGQVPLATIFGLAAILETFGGAASSSACSPGRSRSFSRARWLSPISWRTRRRASSQS
jgi:hypothetical protein